MFYQLVWLFFAFSFLGWVLEVVYTALRQRRYRKQAFRR